MEQFRVLDKDRVAKDQALGPSPLPIVCQASTVCQAPDQCLLALTYRGAPEGPNSVGHMEPTCLSAPGVATLKTVGIGDPTLQGLCLSWCAGVTQGADGNPALV